MSERIPVTNQTATKPGQNGHHKALAIVGSHPTTRELAPYDDPRFDILLFNEAAQKPEVYKRWDMLLQIHLPEVYRSEHNWVNKDHWKWLQEKHGKPIYMQHVDPDVPDSVEYPLDGILKLYPIPLSQVQPCNGSGAWDLSRIRRNLALR